MESISFKELLSYDVKNFIFLIIEPKIKSKVFLKGEIYGNEIIKRYNYDLIDIPGDKRNTHLINLIKEINELWKLQKI